MHANPSPQWDASEGAPEGAAPSRPLGDQRVAMGLECRAHMHHVSGVASGCAFATAVYEAFDAASNQEAIEAALSIRRADQIVQALDDCHAPEELRDFIAGVASAFTRLLVALHD